MRFKGYLTGKYQLTMGNSFFSVSLLKKTSKIKVKAD
jgi:hypothetical protein